MSNYEDELAVLDQSVNKVEEDNNAEEGNDIDDDGEE